MVVFGLMTAQVHVPGHNGPIPCRSGQYTQDWGTLRQDLYRVGGVTTCYDYNRNTIAWRWVHPVRW